MKKITDKSGLDAAADTVRGLGPATEMDAMARREFLKKLGKYAAVTSVTTATVLTAKTVSASSCSGYTVPGQCKFPCVWNPVTNNGHGECIGA